jgi:hypothetical protein
VGPNAVAREPKVVIDHADDWNRFSAPGPPEADPPPDDIRIAAISRPPHGRRQDHRARRVICRDEATTKRDIDTEYVHHIGGHDHRVGGAVAVSQWCGPTGAVPADSGEHPTRIQRVHHGRRCDSAAVATDRVSCRGDEESRLVHLDQLMRVVHTEIGTEKASRYRAHNARHPYPDGEAGDCAQRNYWGGANAAQCVDNFVHLFRAPVRVK